VAHNDGHFTALVPTHRHRIHLEETVPNIGLEPTTLRLAASESVDFPTATDCYNYLLSIIYTKNFFQRTTTQTGPIMTDFDGAWAQKWAQSIPFSTPPSMAMSGRRGFLIAQAVAKLRVVLGTGL
jgi:hypothetical protein